MLDRYYNGKTQATLDKKEHYLNRWVNPLWPDKLKHSHIINELRLYSRVSVLSLKGHTYDIRAYGCSNQIHTWILYHMRSWWIMADDNWSAKMYLIQFQVKETSNKSNGVVSTLTKQLNQSIRLFTYFYSRINLGLHSLIHTLLHSLIHSHNFTHPLAHLIVHAFHHSPTDLLVPSLENSLAHSIIHTFM